MGLRDWGGRGVGASVAAGLDRLNARHPWSHNDHFHSWVVANLPPARRTALDVGCGRGELAALLAERFERVTATDTDARMCAAASRRLAGYDRVEVRCVDLPEVTGPFDVVTMVAVLHRLDLDSALGHVRRLLAPGGRFLVVGLAAPRSPADLAWDAASIVTNPLIGWVKHPWPASDDRAPAPFPVADATLPFDEIRARVDRVMPGALMRRRLGFRYTLTWTAPGT